MIHLVMGSLLLSLVHAAIPNHWLPIVVIARAEKWNSREALWITALTGLAHASSTILVGIGIGLIGYKLSENYDFFTTTIAPVLLILMGLLYFGLDYKHAVHRHLPGSKQLQQKSKLTIIATLCLAMFFSPCLEIDTYFITAGTHGWQGIAAVSLVYLFITVTGMLLLVALGNKGLERFNLHFLEHHEKKVTGTVLILLGLLSFYLH